MDDDRNAWNNAPACVLGTVWGHGVDPDVVVDNLPHATFEGNDAQLQSALELLTKQIQEDPRPVPATPPYPDKSFKYQ